VTIKSEGNTSLLVLFAVLIGISAFLTFIIITVVWCCNGYKCLRFILHVIWNILYIITILTFIIGSAFGVAGVIITDAVPVFNYIFSHDYLMSGKIFKDSEIATKLDICLNGTLNLTFR
jgi:hypothetical protein